MKLCEMENVVGNLHHKVRRLERAVGSHRRWQSSLWTIVLAQVIAMGIRDGVWWWPL